MSKPTFFLAPASWFPSYFLRPVKDALESKGYSTWCEDVPSQQSEPSKGTEADIDFMREAMQAILVKGNDVVVVGWSMSAWSAPAAAEGFYKGSSSHSSGGSVVGLAYLSCVIPSMGGLDGQGIMAEYGGEYGKWYDSEALAQTKMEYGPLVSIGNPGPIFYNGLPAHLDTTELDKHVVPVAGAAFGIVPYVPRRDDGSFVVPTLYITTREDHSVPTRVQDEVIKREGDRFAKVVHVPGGHLVGMTHPDIVCDALIDLAASI